MTKKLQKDAIDSAQALVNLCKSMEYCSECPFAYWNESYDEGISHCTIGCPADSWDIEKVSIKVKETEPEEKPKKIVPFDFTLKEDKQILRGKTVEYHCLHGSGLDKENPVYDIEECNIVGFHKHSGHDYWQAILCYCNSDYTISVTAEELLNNYFYADTGKPVGKEIEE